MATPWDLIVVGGGPAGISTALHVQHANPELGARTLVLEKEHFPREKFCAGGLGRRGLNRLAQLGVHPDVPSVPLHRVEMRTPRHVLHVEEPNFGVVVRRIEFDAALAGAWRSRGGALREGAKVTSITRGGAGVRVTLDDGEVLEARAVVGADGVAGVVRRELGMSGGVHRAQVLELDTEPVEGDPPRDTIRFDASWPDFQGYAWDFPTLVNGQEKVCRGMYLIRTAGEGNVREHLRRYLAARGLNLDDYRSKPFGERGFSPTERLSQERVLLVGEAAGIDIATGEGIAQAIGYGAVAGPYLARAFAQGDLSFQSWTRTVRTSGVGRNLLARLAMYHAFYGAPERRAATETLLHDVPGILEAFARGFSGRGPDVTLATALLRDAPGGLWAAARQWAGR